jgi:parvulin-like peptidyl-prolyl isomerase
MGNHNEFVKGLYLGVCCLLLAVSGCATAPPGEQPLAVVDGELITSGDLEYSLQIAHRREDLSSARTLNMSNYLQKLINDKLIVQEARRMGIGNYDEVRSKVRAFITRESVKRLYNEEIVSRVSVSEQETMNYYKDNYKDVTLDIIETKNRKDLETIFKKLTAGESFERHSAEHPSTLPGKKGAMHKMQWKSLTSDIKEALSKLKPGEFTDVINNKLHVYLIIKLISIQEAAAEGFQKAKAGIELDIKQQKTQARSNTYLAELRSKADIKINREILSSINPSGNQNEKAKWLEDERPLVEVSGNILTVSNFAAMLPPNAQKYKETALNNWIDRKVVDLEAFSRAYDKKTDLGSAVTRYEEEVIKNVFRREVIFPRLQIKEEDVKEYYFSHREDYARPIMYKIQQITVNTREDAQKVLNSLMDGASFSWLASRWSTDSSASSDSTISWITANELPGQAKNIIEDMEPGSISSILEIDSEYRIIKLLDKTEKVYEDFNRAKPLARKAVFREQFRNIYKEYVNKLKQTAEIKIIEEALRSFEKRFQQ